MDERAALRLEQADHRRLSRRRLAEPGGPGAGASVSGIDGRVIAHRLMGDWEPTPAFYAAADRARTRRTPTSAGPIRSSWPIRWKASPTQLGDPADWHGGMEVGRHPLAVDPARRADVPLVARRGAGHRALPGTRRRSAAAARRHRDRRRDPAVEGRRAVPFAQLQRRIGRKVLGRRSWPRCRSCWWRTTCWNRRARMSASGRSSGGARSWRSWSARSSRPAASCSPPVVDAESWDELRGTAQRVARAQRGGLHAQAPRLALSRRPEARRLVEVEGRALLVDCVLIYAQPGSGRRASLSPTTPSASGTRANWCRSPRPIPA